MKRNYLFLIVAFMGFLSAFYFTACKKDKNKIVINGKVFDPNLKTYLSDVIVTISSIRISSGYYNSNYSDIATTTTDNNGNFSFEFEKEKSAGYRFTITKDNYFESIKDIPDADIVAGTPYSPEFYLYPKAYIKLHVQNSAPWNDNDFIAYSYTSGYLSCYQCCTNTTFQGHGQSYDTTLKCKTYGNQNIVINWHVTKMGTDIAYADTVFCDPFDTTFFEILY